MHYMMDKSVYDKVRDFKKKITRDMGVGAIVEMLSDEVDVRALLMSEKLMSLPAELRDEVLVAVAEVFKGQEVESLVSFVMWAMGSQEKEYRRARVVSKDWGVEFILSCCETFLMKMQCEGVAPDGGKYPDYIIDSQCQHLLSALGSVLYFAVKEKYPYKMNVMSCEEVDVFKFVNGLSHYESLRSFVLEVANGNNIPVDISKMSPAISAKNLDYFVGRGRYLLEWYSRDWRKLEIYRDLNYQFNYHHEDDLDVLASLMAQSKAGRYIEGDGGFLHVDLSRGEDFEREFKAYKIIQHLAPLYGVGEMKVQYKGVGSSVGALVQACIALNDHAERVRVGNLERIRRNKKARVSRLSLDKLLGVLGFANGQVNLLDLLVSDFSESIVNMDVPIFKIEGHYVVIPSHVISLCFEKVIDKILSRRDVFVEFPVGMKKGLSFEREISEIIVSSGRSVHRINGKGDKGVPEVDGIFDVDPKNIAVCEVKCSIKPEGRRDAYGFTENHLSTALGQLDVRYDFLCSASPEMAKSYGVSLDGKEITLLIVTNHNYFLGLAVRTPKGRPAFVVDVKYFYDVLVRGVVPVWKFNKVDRKYMRYEKNLMPGEHMNALRRPLANLLGWPRDTVQFQETGVGIYIYKPPIVDDRSYYPESLLGALEGL